MTKKKIEKDQVTHYTISVDNYEYYYHFGKKWSPRIFEEEYEDLDESNCITIFGYMAKESDDKKVSKDYKVEFNIRPSYVFGKHNTKIEYWGYGERNRNTEILRLSMSVPKDSFSNILEMLSANKVKFITICGLSLKYNKTRIKNFSLHTYLDPEDY